MQVKKFQADGASLRQRKKSDTFPFPEGRRKNSIKDGIDELQRIIPHLVSMLHFLPASPLGPML